MERVMEFFVSADEVWYHDAEGMHPLRESSPVVAEMWDLIEELYPLAFSALCECYDKSRSNVSYFRFLVVRRFCKCNFGRLDHTRKDVAGVFNFECVSCPLRGECKYEEVICSPKLETALSEAEKRVMRLVCDGLSNSEIAGELYLSPNTVKRHISNSFIKTRTRNRAEFVKYASEIGLFN